MRPLSARWRVPNAHYTDRNFQVFLQGSYGNDTNVLAESDVDVVIRYDGAFFHDVTALPSTSKVRSRVPCQMAHIPTTHSKATSKRP